MRGLAQVTQRDRFGYGIQPGSGGKQALVPPTVPAGKVRCPMCRNAVSVTPSGRFRRHRDLFGNDCVNRRDVESSSLAMVPDVEMPARRGRPPTLPRPTPDPTAEIVAAAQVVAPRSRTEVEVRHAAELGSAFGACGQRVGEAVGSVGTVTCRRCRTTKLYRRAASDQGRAPLGGAR